MGILRWVEGELTDRFLGSASAPIMDPFTLAPPGTAAASRPPPVAARNCLRSTDLLPRELPMPDPQKCTSHAGQITTRGIIRLLSRRGSHKIVLLGTKCEEFVQRRIAHTPLTGIANHARFRVLSLRLLASKRVQSGDGNSGRGYAFRRHFSILNGVHEHFNRLTGVRRNKDSGREQSAAHPCLTCFRQPIAARKWQFE